MNPAAIVIAACYAIAMIRLAVDQLQRGGAR